MLVLGRSAFFESPYPPNECIARLNEMLGSSFNPFSSSSYVGMAAAWRVSIRKNVSYRNSWQTVFVGDISAAPQGTRIIGTFRMNLFVMAFTALWLGIVTLAFFAWLFATLGDGADPNGLMLVSLMLALSVGLIIFCRYLARDEEHAIADFPADLIEATEVSRVVALRP